MLSVSDVRDLAAYRGEPVVTSFYLDVDGRSSPRPSDYQSRVEALFRVARERAGRLGASVAAAVEADLADIRRWLDEGVDRSEARGLAAFSCHGDGFWRAYALPAPVEDHVGLGPSPRVAQLSELAGRPQHTLVALADRQRSRLVRLDGGHVTEVAGPFDPVERQLDTDVELGSWEHRREEKERQHLRRVARAVADEVRDRPTDRVVLGGPADVVDRLEPYLAVPVAAVVVGRVALGLAASHEDIAAAVAGVAHDVDHERAVGLVEELRARAARGAGGVTGLPDTLEALADHRVGTLLVTRGFRAWGARCPSCGRLGVDTRQCPWCGATTEEVDDVVEVAVREALVQRAAIEFCEGTELDDVGRIGALQRY